MVIRNAHRHANEPQPYSFRLPVLKIMGVLLVLGVGLSGLVMVAIAPQLLPQFQSLWRITHHALELTLGNTGDVENRVSLLTWYLSSVLLLAAMLSFGMSLISGKRSNTRAISTIHQQQSGWVMLGASLVLFSADKSTGLHHALNHDVLYRFPFALDLKKQLVLFAFLGLLTVFLLLIQPLWKTLFPSSKRLLLLAGFCFVFSEVGMDGLAYFLMPSDGSVHFLWLSFLEALIDQLGGLFLVAGLLWQLKMEIGKS